MVKKSFILTDKENRWLRKKAYLTGLPEIVIIRTIIDGEITKERQGLDLKHYRRRLLKEKENLRREIKKEHGDETTIKRPAE